MQLSGFMESIVSRSDQRRFGPFFKRGKLERGIGEAFSLGPTCRHSLESGEDRIGFLPTGSFFGHLSLPLQKPAAYSTFLKIGPILIRKLVLCWLDRLESGNLILRLTLRYE
jgi:hypothetical protein